LLEEDLKVLKELKKSPSYSQRYDKDIEDEYQKVVSPFKKFLTQNEYNSGIAKKQN